MRNPATTMVTHAYVGTKDGQITMFWPDDGTSNTVEAVRIMRSSGHIVTRMPIKEALATVEGERKS